MAVINSYYLYQKYEKRGNQPWIPCYPNTWSVDADGTMPPVLKQQDDPSCYHPIYRWVQTEDTICIDTTTIEYRTTSGTPYCDGYDKYVDTTYEQSFDGGVTWEFVSSSSTLVETDSEYCGYEPTPEVQYRWTESGTTCDNANKYKRYIKQVSYDGGEAWLVVQPPQYSAGTLVESDSYDCGYRTSATTSATYCSNANQYVDVYSLVSRDYGETWSTASTSTELIEEDVVECGFSARTISTATTCVGVDKHYLDEYQESYDFGQTWTTISSSTGSLIEAKSADCGYAERTISGTPYCDGADLVVVTSAQTSSDSGSTWTTVSTAITMVESGSSQCHQTIHVTGVTLNKNSMSLNSGSSETLVATVSPSNADDKSVTWSSNNTSVATVNSSGLVSAVTSGSATITVTTTDGGYTAQCSVSVSVPIPASPKFILTLSDASTVSAECDSTSSITQAEISAYTSTTVSAEIGECVTSIDDFAFYEYTSLTSCTLGDSVTSIGGWAFNSCSGLTNIDIPNSVISIDTFAFSTCTNLTSIDIPDSVTNIGGDVFLYCLSLTSVTIGSGVTSIGWDAFKDCTSLASVTVNATTPPTLGANAFDNTNDCPIYVPCASVDTYKAASGWSTYASRIEGIPPCGSPTPTGAKFAVTLTNSSAITAACDSTSAITSAETSSFRTNILTATIGDCVTEIGAEAFSYGLGYLPITSLTLSNSVTTLRNNAFHFSSLYDVDLKNVTTLWNGCFSYSHNLSSVTMSNVVDIKRDAFWGCDKLVRVNSNVDGVINIPSTVTSIGTNPFANCPLITSVTVDSSNTVYDSRNNCNAAIKTSSNALIIGCKNTVIPNTVRSIGSWAFRGYDIPSITIPDGVTTIGSGAFEGCTSLTSITIPDSVTYINSDAFRGCFNLEGLSIGSGVTTISQYAFSRCRSLTSVTIPNNVTFIGKEAFYGCTGLTSVTLGSSVNTIGDSGFINCTSLQSITCLSTGAPSLGSSVFDGTNDCPIYVPSGSVNDYKAVWSSYSSRIQAIPNS